MSEKTIEELASEFHKVYQEEAKRQGDVRHKHSYEELPESVKEFDRALARYVLKEFVEKSKVEGILDELRRALPLPENEKRWAYAYALEDVGERLLGKRRSD